MPNGRVLGADACKSGWVGVALSGPHTHAYVAALITTLVSLAADDGDLLAVARRWQPGRRVDLLLTRRIPFPIHRRGSTTVCPVRSGPSHRRSAQQRNEVIDLARIGHCERVDDGGEGSSRRAPRGLFMYPPHLLARHRYLPAPSAGQPLKRHLQRGGHPHRQDPAAGRGQSVGEYPVAVPGAGRLDRDAPRPT